MRYARPKEENLLLLIKSAILKSANLKPKPLSPINKILVCYPISINYSSCFFSTWFVKTKLLCIRSAIILYPLSLQCLESVNKSVICWLEKFFIKFSASIILTPEIFWKFLIISLIPTCISRSPSYPSTQVAGRMNFLLIVSGKSCLITVGILKTYIKGFYMPKYRSSRNIK